MLLKLQTVYLLIKNKANKKDFLWNYKVITIISTKFSAIKSAIKHDLMTFQYLVCSHTTRLLLIGFDFWLLKCKVTWGRFCDLPLFVPFSESVRLSMQYVVGTVTRLGLWRFLYHSWHKLRFYKKIKRCKIVFWYL